VNAPRKRRAADERMSVHDPHPVALQVQGDEPRMMPHNLEAERSVFGAVMIENKAFHVALAVLPDAKLFYRDAHRRIWRAMIQLDEQNRPIELVTMKDQLEANGDLEEVGGAAYLASLVDGIPHSTNVKHYAEIVKDKAALRALVRMTAEIAIDALDADRSAAEILRAAEGKLFALANGHIPSQLQDLKAGVKKLNAELAFRMENKGAVTGIDTGFQEINRHTLGWQRGNLIFIGARPSIGKTTFALNCAVAAAKAGKKVAYFSMEMTREELEFRILSNLSGVGLTRILNGALGGSDFGKIAHAMDEMAELPLYIDDQPARTDMDIRSTCRQLQAEHGLDEAVIDYAQLFKGSLGPRATRNEQLTSISNNLKALSRELRVPIIVLSQIARRSLHTPDPRPKISDLKDCGAFEQDADVVALLHRRKHEEDGPTEIILAKVRNGAPGSYVITLIGDTVQFIDGGTMPVAEPRNVTPGKKIAGKVRPPALPMRDDGEDND
jgi:replicative DNA helicase